MGIIHCRTKDWSIYVPPKCGTGVVDQFVHFPEFEGHFYIDHSEDWKPKYSRTIMVRNHVDRVASTFYEKIVDPIGGTAGSLGWRQNSNPEEALPSAAGYIPQFYQNFESWVYGLSYHCFDDHLAPYTSQPIIQAALQPGPGGGEFSALCFPSEASHLFFSHVLEYLEIPLRAQKSALDRWRGLKNPHKIRYAHASKLPPPEYYGADHWSKVDYENLYGCYQQHGALPYAQYLYTEDLHERIKSQIGYQRDLWSLMEWYPKEYPHIRVNPCSLVLREEGEQDHPEYKIPWLDL